MVLLHRTTASAASPAAFANNQLCAWSLETCAHNLGTLTVRMLPPARECDPDLCKACAATCHGEALTDGNGMECYNMKLRLHQVLHMMTVTEVLIVLAPRIVGFHVHLDPTPCVPKHTTLL